MINYRAFEARLFAFLDAEGHLKDRDAYEEFLDQGDVLWGALTVDEMEQINKEGLLRSAREGILEEAAVEWGEKMGVADVRKINEEAKAGKRP